MTTRKIIVIDEELDSIMGAICDSALKGAGMNMLASVSKMVESVIEEDIPEPLG